MSTQTHQLSAAEALAALIPTTTPVTAALADPASPKPTGNAVSASFIGSVSADLSIVLADIGSVAGAAVERAEVAVGDADVRVVDVAVDDERDPARVGAAST